jgi:hypothetical protein
MRVTDAVRTIISRYQAGVADRDTALQQVRVVVDESGVEPEEILFVLANDDMTRIGDLRDRLAQRPRNGA